MKKKGKQTWVTFSLPKTVGESVEVCGEWNGWKRETMKQKKSGEFYLRRKLENQKNYQFGYRIDGKAWQCDDTLGCVPSPFDSHNSLLEL